MKRIYNNDIQAVLISSAHNLHYFTGFTGGEGFAVITPDEKILYVDGRYTIQARLQAFDCTVIEYSGNVFSEIAKLKYRRYGIEDRYISYAVYLKLSQTVKDGFYIGVSDELEQIRSIKSKAEIDNIKTAEEIGDAAFEHILKHIKDGVTEKEIAFEIDLFMRKNGAEKNSFDTIVAFGERAALPHAFPTDRRLSAGELVLVDFGCCFNGYCGDMTRTICFGKANERQKEIYNLVLSAQLKALDTIKSGVICKEVDSAARELFNINGYGGNFNHSLGHGTGLLIHEQPNLSPRSEIKLKENMVVTVEPGLYFENELGIRIEDLIVVTKDGFCNLTKSPKDLIEWS